jgi:hypothetical protein
MIKHISWSYHVSSADCQSPLSYINGRLSCKISGDTLLTEENLTYYTFKYVNMVEHMNGFH